MGILQSEEGILVLLCSRAGFACCSPSGLRRRRFKPQQTRFANAVDNLRGNRWFLKHRTHGSGSFGALSLREVGFCYHWFAKNKNILYSVLHSDDLILIKTILWDLWFWLSIWAEGTVLPSYLSGRGFVMRHLLCFWSKYFCDKCYIKSHKDMNNPVFSEEFKLNTINKTRATHWLGKVKKEILNSSVHPAR